MKTQSNTPRIDPLQPPYDPDLSATLKRWMPPDAPVEPLALFRVLAIHREMMDRMRPLGAGILGHGTLDIHEREILIQRVCALCGCEYEWGVHGAWFGPRVGIGAEQLRATVTAQSSDPIWSEREALIIRLADSLHRDATLPDDLWDQLVERWNRIQIIEMLIVAGWYRLIAYIANATGLPPEEWAVRFPSG